MILRLNKRPRLIPRTAHRDVHRVHRQIKRKTKRLWTQISPSGIRNSGNLTNVVYIALLLQLQPAFFMASLYTLSRLHTSGRWQLSSQLGRRMGRCRRGLIRPRRWGPGSTPHEDGAEQHDRSSGQHETAVCVTRGSRCRESETREEGSEGGEGSDSWLEMVCLQVQAQRV